MSVWNISDQAIMVAVKSWAESWCKARTFTFVVIPIQIEAIKPIAVQIISVVERKTGKV